MAEPRAGLAGTALASGATADALRQVGGILEYLLAGQLTQTIEPLDVCLTCYRVLQAADDVQAPELSEKVSPNG